ncbi:molybdopterin converting factor subunit 1 [Ramlibacter sp. MMS24-I3-19]|uniref:molybdopterin converting factor subunit 1 n=1 Tax=Ramlibacter sp. MMS24-I3-19 TaxID=3416606 RepID=UPI003CFBE8FC
MKVQLRYFASVREAVGRGSEEHETRAATLRQLRDELAGQGAPYAEALAGRAVRMALDQVMVQDDAPLHDGCEVAFFPPVTGG